MRLVRKLLLGAGRYRLFYARVAYEFLSPSRLELC